MVQGGGEGGGGAGGGGGGGGGGVQKEGEISVLFELTQDLLTKVQNVLYFIHIVK